MELNMTWEGYNDDDEFKEFPVQKQLHIFGCLGCNQTYQTKARAKAHWKKSEKCHKDHLKNANKYLEKIQKFEKSQGDKSWIDALSNKELFDAVERLARWYHRVVHMDMPFLLDHPVNKGLKFDDKYLKHTIKSANDIRSREERLLSYKKYMKQIRDFEIYIGRTVTLPFDYKIPSPWSYTSSPDDDGLPPVGTNFEAKIKAGKEEEVQRETSFLLKKEKLLKEALAQVPEPEPTLEPLSRSTTPMRKLEPIAEEPVKKEKRPSFTMSNKDINAFLRSPSPSPQQKIPTIISNTKTEKKVRA
jgi:hypothetical protein